MPREEAPSGEQCPACESLDFYELFRGTDRLYGTTERIFAVVECRTCRLMRLFPWPSTKEMHRFYPQQYWYGAEPSANDRLEEIYRRFVLRDHVAFVESSLERSKANGMVLDVGCGGGLFLRLLRERGWPGVGLDFSQRAADIAWHGLGVPVVCGNLTEAPLPPESCAAITMFHVLEHLHDPASYIQHAHRLLAPDGRLIVQTPNADSWQFLLLGERWNGVDLPRHLIDFRASDLRVLLQSCGFTVCREKHFSLRDNPAGLATSLAPRLDPMARRVRQIPEGGATRFTKNLLHLGLTVVALPFTLLEAAAGSGSTIMMEARKNA